MPLSSSLPGSVSNAAFFLAQPTSRLDSGRPDIRDEVVAALRDTMPTLLQPVRNDITRVKTELAGARRDIRRNGRLIGLVSHHRSNSLSRLCTY